MSSVLAFSIGEVFGFSRSSKKVKERKLLSELMPFDNYPYHDTLDAYSGIPVSENIISLSPMGFESPSINNCSFHGALQSAYLFAEKFNGSLATLPYFISQLSDIEPDSYLLRETFIPHTEQYRGWNKDSDEAGTELIIMHGGGIFSPKMLATAELYFRDARWMGMPQGEDVYQSVLQKLFLYGRLPSGEHPTIYSVDDIRKGKVKNPFGRYGVRVTWSDEEKITFNRGKNDLKYFTKKQFLDHPIALAYAGSLENLECWYDAILKHKEGNKERVNPVIGWSSDYYSDGIVEYEMGAFTEFDWRYGSVRLANFDYDGTHPRFLALIPKEERPKGLFNFG